MNKEQDSHYLYHQLLKEICDEENIQIQFFSDSWIMALTKDKQRRMIVGYKFDHNGHGLGGLIDDKAALSEYLNFYQIPNVKHHIIYSPSNHDTYACRYNHLGYLKELFHLYQNDVVLKPNGGTSGMGVSHITSLDELEEKFNTMKSPYDIFSLCPYLEIKHEYRAIMLNGAIELLYQKELPEVIGDGVSTIKELLEQFNFEYFKNYQGSNQDKVLLKGEKYLHNWKFNLSGGARANLNVEKSISDEVSALAIKVAELIGLQFGSVDIIQTKDGHYLVMEINSGVMMENFMKENEEGYLMAKRIYRKAILHLFS